MLNSAAAGRRLALRAAVYQAVAVLLVAVAFLPKGIPQAVAVALGGLSVVVGWTLAARLALGGGVVAAGSAMARLLLAMICKWAVVIALLWLGAGIWKLPPALLLTGVVTGLVVQVLASARRN